MRTTQKAEVVAKLQELGTGEMVNSSVILEAMPWLTCGAVSAALHSLAEEGHLERLGKISHTH